MRLHHLSINFSIITILLLSAFLPNDNVQVPQSSFTDSIKIGKQVWATKNLDTDKFANGEIIFHAKSDFEWLKASREGTPAWCYYEHNAANGQKYGRIYNWPAVRSYKRLAPKGWHIPLSFEWKTLITNLGGEDVAGKKAKSQNGWKGSGNGTNSSGFSALPGGNTWPFQNIGSETLWWTYSEIADDEGFLADYETGVVSCDLTSRMFIGEATNSRDGYYVRCIKN
jgi:uncharacterized protein (TIGR02145 family)